tara:strand:- start:33 stop:266 length:234 start_codon:yes stop_codon:yes gene_type:complete
MKDRFWKAYFFVMWFMFLFGLFALQDAEGLITDDFLDNWFIANYYGSDSWGWWLIYLFIPLTIIRWISTGKHFWNKP